MEKQILEELYGKLRELIPDFETREEGNKNYISYKMQINDKDFETSVVITNGRAVAITGKRTYIYQIKEKSCEQFNNEVQTRYPLFQIYGGNGNISVGRRLLFDSVDELVTNIREFNSVCKAVIPQFEGSCVNFLVKTREEETYDPTQTFTPLEEESSNEKNADYVDSFVKDQQEYCKKTFYELAEGAEPVTKGNDVSFIRNEGDGSLKVTMDKNAPEDLKLDYAYVVDDQELAYIAIANITSMWYNTINLDSGLDRQSAGCRGEYFYIQYKPRIAFSNYKKGCCFMKKKVISMLLAVSMISTSPIYAAEFSDGNSVVVNDADAVNGTDADSADSAEVPDTSLFSSDAVDGADVVNDSVDAGEDSAENAFSDQEVPDVDDGSGSGVDAAEMFGFVNGVYDYKLDLRSSYKISAVDQAALKIISEAGITSQNTDLEKICMIMAWFRKNTSYSNINETENQSPYGSLVLRRSVCAGFATGLSVLLTKMGITNSVEAGDNFQSDGHAWVEVKLNNKYYILDATATCYNPGSFLEDYNGFWYKADGMSSHNVCGSEFSSKNIPASNVKYLGASGNDLYVSTNAGYYVNEGTGWNPITELPSQLYGSSDFSISTEIDNIIGDGYPVKDPILSGSSRTTRFYISNPGAAESQEAAESLSCRVDNDQIASAKITARGKGWVDVTVTGKSAGTTTLSVFAPNGVTGTLPITALNASVSKAPVIQAHVKKNLPFVYLKWDLTKDVLNNANSMGYQIMVGDPKTGEYTLDNDVRLDESDFEKDYFASATIGFGDTKKVKVRLYEKLDDGTVSYGDYSNELTVSTTPGYVRMKSVSMKNNKAYLKWSKSENADGYVVYRRIGKTGKYKKIKTINSGNTLKYTNSKLINGKKYCYKVKAFHVTPEGKKLYTNWSNVISRTCK